jgi:hypothetical protein
MIWFRITLFNTLRCEITGSRVVTQPDDTTELDTMITEAARDLITEHWPLLNGDILTVNKIHRPRDADAEITLELGADWS